MSEDEIEVRELKTRDVFTVSKILLSLSDEAAQEISTIVSKEDLESDDEEEEKEIDEEAETRTGIQLAISVGQILIENAEGELLDWLADMANMEREEFEESAIDTPLIVIEDIIEQEGFQNFLSRASSLYKKMNSSAGQYLDS